MGGQTDQQLADEARAMAKQDEAKAQEHEEQEALSAQGAVDAEAQSEEE